jgi:serpin B
MHQTDRFGYADDPAWQALELPYAGGALAMVVVLPRADEGLSDLEAKLTPDWLGKTTAALRPERVVVSLPRWKVTWGQELTDQLRALGMDRAFTPAADFSRMSTADRLMIDVVVHKAFVDVNEEGTEAAAATGVGVKLAAAPVEAPPKVFQADHPFLFLIRDRATGSVLFLGRVANPA